MLREGKNNNHWIIGFLLLISCLSACDNELKVNADWREIAIVYGLFDLNDTVQYIKINKAFLGNQSALVSAQIADSLYLDATTKVQLQEWTDDDVLVEEHILAQTEATALGIDKDEGIFANTPYYLYPFDQSLDPNHHYELFIQTPSGQEIRSSTAIVNDFKVWKPDIEFPLSTTDDFTLKWERPSLAHMYELDVVFHYTEHRLDESGAVVVHQESQKWDVFSNLKLPPDARRADYSIEAERFYSAFSTRIPEDSLVLFRQFRSLDFVFYAGTEEFVRYVEAVRANIGITSSQAFHNYSNVENGLGLFTSRLTKEIKGVELSAASIDRLACGSNTRHLRFTSSEQNPFYPECE